MNLKKSLTDMHLLKFLKGLLPNKGAVLDGKQIRMLIIRTADYLKKNEVLDASSPVQKAALLNLFKRKNQTKGMAPEIAEILAGQLHHSTARRRFNATIIPANAQTIYAYYVYDSSANDAAGFLKNIAGVDAPITRGKGTDITALLNFEMLSQTRSFTLAFDADALSMQRTNPEGLVRRVMDAGYVNFRETHDLFKRSGDTQTGEMLFHALNLSMITHGVPHPEFAGVAPAHTISDALNLVLRNHIAKEMGMIKASHDDIEMARFLLFSRGNIGRVLAIMEATANGKIKLRELLEKVHPSYPAIYDKISNGKVTPEIEKLAETLDALDKGKVLLPDPKKIIPVILKSLEQGTVYQNTPQALIDDLYKVTSLDMPDKDAVARVKAANTVQLGLAVQAVICRRYLQATQFLMPELFAELVIAPERTMKIFAHLGTKPGSRSVQ